MALTIIGYDVVEHAASAEEAVKKTVELEPGLILMRAIIRESKKPVIYQRGDRRGRRV